MKPAHGYVTCPVCHHGNIHATADGKVAVHHQPVTSRTPCPGSGKPAVSRKKPYDRAYDGAGKIIRYESRARDLVEAMIRTP